MPIQKFWYDETETVLCLEFSDPLFPHEFTEVLNEIDADLQHSSVPIQMVFNLEDHNLLPRGNIVPHLWRAFNRDHFWRITILKPSKFTRSLMKAFEQLYGLRGIEVVMTDSVVDANYFIMQTPSRQPHLRVISKRSAS